MKMLSLAMIALTFAACGAPEESTESSVETSLDQKSDAVSSILGEFGGGTGEGELFNLALREDGTFVGHRAVECAALFGLDCGKIMGNYVVSTKGTTKYITLDDLNGGAQIAKYSYSIYAGSFKLTNTKTRVKTNLALVALTSCNADADCVAVSEGGCCPHGEKVAVSVSEQSVYEEAYSCVPVGAACPLFVINDTRVAACKVTTHKCEMIAPN